MSRVFNDTDGKSGLVQMYEEAMGYEDAYVSGSTTRLKRFTSKTRTAFDRFISLAFEADGRWQYDDSNHTKYAEVEMDLVSGQRDYTLLTDEQGNVVLDIHKVLVKDPSGVYTEVFPVDKNGDNQFDSAPFLDGQDVQGVPTRYDRTANGIIFDYVPNYSWRVGTELERGIKVIIDRESSYFIYTDTSKMPGVPGNLHDYFWAYPAMIDASLNNRTNAGNLAAIVSTLEENIKKTFTRRGMDDRKRITFKKINYI